MLDPGAVERLKTTAARYVLNWRPSQRILVVWTGPMLVPDYPRSGHSAQALLLRILTRSEVEDAMRTSSWTTPPTRARL